MRLKIKETVGGHQIVNLDGEPLNRNSNPTTLLIFFKMSTEEIAQLPVIEKGEEEPKTI